MYTTVCAHPVSFPGVMATARVCMCVLLAAYALAGVLAVVYPQHWNSQWTLLTHAGLGALVLGAVPKLSGVSHTFSFRSCAPLEVSTGDLAQTVPHRLLHVHLEAVLY